MHRKVAGEFLHDVNVIMQLKITDSSFVDRVSISIVLRIRYCIYLSHVSKYLLLCFKAPTISSFY